MVGCSLNCIALVTLAMVTLAEKPANHTVSGWSCAGYGIVGKRYLTRGTRCFVGTYRARAPRMLR